MNTQMRSLIVAITAWMLTFYPRHAVASLHYRTLYSGGKGAYSTEFSPRGDFVASVICQEYEDDQSRIYLWRTRGGKLVHVLNVPYAVKLVFSPDSKKLAVLSGSRGRYEVEVPYAIEIWDVNSGRCSQTLVKAGSTDIGFYSIAFSPDSRLLASGSGDSIVRVWDVATGKRFAKFKHGSFPNTLAFSPDGQFLASGGGNDDGIINLWSMRSKNLVKSLDKNAAGWNFSNAPLLAFTPGSKHLTIEDGNLLSFYQVPALICLRKLPTWEGGDFEPFSSQSLLPRDGALPYLMDNHLVLRNPQSGRVVKRYNLGFDFENSQASRPLLAFHVTSHGPQYWVTCEDENGRIRLYHAT